MKTITIEIELEVSVDGGELLSSGDWMTPPEYSERKTTILKDGADVKREVLELIDEDEIIDIYDSVL